MSKLTIFLTGATGYIGGSVLWRLLNHKDASKFSIKVLVRNAEKAKLFKPLFNVDATVGSHADHDKLESLASEADYTFATADCDDIGAAEAILRGMKKYKERTGKAAFLIHTSGTGVLADDARGMFAYDKVYDDSNVEDIESLAPSQIHRPVDIAVTEADKAGYAKTYIILPSTIYGISKNRLTEAGIQNPHSIQLPMLIRASVDRGQGGMVGEGKNKWPNVNIDDQADLYIILFDKTRTDPEGTPHGREGYYFGASGEHTMLEVCKEVAKSLVVLGKGKSLEPTTFTQEDLDKYFNGSPYLGSNSRCIANRSRSVGWKPAHTTSDFIASIRPEVEALIVRDQGKGYVGRADGGKSKN
ncbi:hypothetical protein EW145_g2403 [Phellinidium pouzarii]|uniref:NmrA-like domain-containing protein n=1 Tax=Phellinidium pouzarii TaxID=167371 RepID=A0A4S4LAZ6_9AGAM|nr:hypothetical protein EW145_g2403 [Phellinidium pouzarii]